MLLIDLDQRRVIDLLPDRAQDSFAHWLHNYPETRLPSRDRSGDYAAAAATGAPQAEQIASRFHLLVNAEETMEQYLTGQHVSLREAARLLGPTYTPRHTSKQTPADEQRRQQRRAARKARYEQVVALHQEGLSVHQIAAEVGLARATIHRYIRAACFPERMPLLSSRQIDPYILISRISRSTGTRANTVREPSGARSTLKATRRTSGRYAAWSKPGVHQLLRRAVPASRYQPKTKSSRIHRAKPAGSSPKPTPRSRRVKPATWSS